MVQRSDRRLAALIEAGMALSAELDLDTLLQRTADMAREVIEAHYAAVGVVDESGQLTRFVHSGVDQTTVDAIGHLPEGTGVLGVIIREGRPFRLRDIKDHPASAGFPENHPEMKTFLGAPIMGRDHVLGRLYLTEKVGGGEFTKDDERISLMFASQAGVAIENARLYEEVRVREEELAKRVAELSSVEQMGTLLIRGTEIDEVLVSIVEEVRKLLRAKRATLVLHDPTTGEMVIRWATGDPHAEDLVGKRLGPRASKAEAVMKRQRAEIVGELSSDPEIDEETMRVLGLPDAGAFAPLVVQGKGIGALAAFEPEVGRFTQSDLDLLQILANQAAIAIENDRLSEALADLAILEERERISKELHDGVIQSIYSVGLSLQGSLSLLAREPERARSRIDEAINELDNVVRDVRSYIFELQPKLVQEQGMAFAIQQLARDLEVNALAEVAVHLEEDACGRLDQEQEIQVVQVVREVLSNIARHARASEVLIRCSLRDSQVSLVVEDDGIGFDPSTVERGHGLTNMEKRAEQLGGTLSIGPRDPRGTTHTVTFPISGGA